MRMLSSVFWPLPCLSVLGDNDACTYMSSGSLLSSFASPTKTVGCAAPCWVCALKHCRGCAASVQATGVSLGGLQATFLLREGVLVHGRQCCRVAPHPLWVAGWQGCTGVSTVGSMQGWECKYCNLTHVCLACWAAVQVCCWLCWPSTAGRLSCHRGRAVCNSLVCLSVSVCVRATSLPGHQEVQHEWGWHLVCCVSG